MHVSKVGQKLMIKIRDNGVGRGKSQELNKRRHPIHKYFATEANIKRLELLNLDKNEILWHYIDHYSPEGDAEGTEVILKIPIQRA